VKFAGVTGREVTGWRAPLRQVLSGFSCCRAGASYGGIFRSANSATWPWGVDWRFIAAHDPVLGDYQYVDLVDSMAAVSDNAAARHLAADARGALGLPLPVAAESEEPPRQVSRRGFLRAFTGRR
jgi:hypothetical protein